MSQQLSTLEKETGVPLLEPAARRVRLTPQAEVLVEHAERLLAEVERAEAALTQSLHDVVGTLRVAAFQTAVLALVPRTLLRLADEHPGLRVEVTEAEPESPLPALVSGQFDLVLGEEYPGRPLRRPRETERQDLFTDELRLATRYCSTDLQIHLTLVVHGLAAAFVSALSGAAAHDGVVLHALPTRPARAVFAPRRLGADEHPTQQAFNTALTQVHHDLTHQQR